MARRDLVSAGGLAALALVYLAASRSYPLDTLAAPGPGVFPLAVGLSMLALAACQALAATGAFPTARPGPSPDRPARGRVRALAAVLVGYALAAGTLGFLTASFVLVLAASRLLGAPGWGRPAALAAGVTAAAYAIFVLWLAVPLPRGPLP